MDENGVRGNDVFENIFADLRKIHIGVHVRCPS